MIPRNRSFMLETSQIKALLDGEKAAGIVDALRRASEFSGEHLAAEVTSCKSCFDHCPPHLHIL